LIKDISLLYSSEDIYRVYSRVEKKAKNSKPKFKQYIQGVRAICQKKALVAYLESFSKHYNKVFFH